MDPRFYVIDIDGTLITAHSEKVEPLTCADRLRPEELFTPTRRADVESVPP